jgi:hypothetical protein
MGGYFDNPFSHPGSGAIAYGLEQQQLENQRQLLGNLQNNQNVSQQQQPNLGNTYGCGGRMHCFGGRLFDYGGGMPNSHGSDFTNGLVYIEEGGTHEENPYQGVPMGYDQQGVPNVVEEDEIVVPKRMLGNGGNVSDYVLSNRIPITDEFAEKYHLPQGISIAKAAKRLTKESRENPNDIILERTTAKLMQEMRDMQEQIKEDMQEQQMQRQMAEQQYAQAMGIPQQAMSVPQEQEAIDIGAMEEQAAQEQAPEMQEPMMAFGGNLFGGGGYFGGGAGGSTLSGGSGQGGGGGSSYISGHTGCVAIASVETITPKVGCTNGTTDITCSYHYSGKRFTNTVMKSGNESMPTHDGTGTMTGNTGNGYAKITYLGN